MKKPTSIIVGPAEKIESLGYYMPRAIVPPCESASPHVPGGARYTKKECDAILDAFAQKHRERGVRVIRVQTMEERDAILTFVRQSVDSLASRVALSVRLYAHEEGATQQTQSKPSFSGFVETVGTKPAGLDWDDGEQAQGKGGV